MNSQSKKATHVLDAIMANYFLAKEGVLTKADFLEVTLDLLDRFSGMNEPPVELKETPGFETKPLVSKTVRTMVKKAADKSASSRKKLSLRIAGEPTTVYIDSDIFDAYEKMAGAGTVKARIAELKLSAPGDKNFSSFASEKLSEELEELKPYLS